MPLNKGMKKQQKDVFMLFFCSKAGKYSKRFIFPSFWGGERYFGLLLNQIKKTFWPPSQPNLKKEAPQEKEKILVLAP